MQYERDVTVSSNTYRHAFANLHGSLFALETALFFEVVDAQLVAEIRETGRPALESLVARLAAFDKLHDGSSGSKVVRDFHHISKLIGLKLLERCNRCTPQKVAHAYVAVLEIRQIKIWSV